MDCIFCRIVAGEIPAQTIYKDDKTVAFLDVNPSTLGHTLVIPKAHWADIQSLPSDLAEFLFGTVSKVAKMLEKAFSTKHFTIGFNNGRLSGQEVDHIHVHLLPRFEGDGEIGRAHV